MTASKDKGWWRETCSMPQQFAPFCSCCLLSWIPVVSACVSQLLGYLGYVGSIPFLYWCKSPGGGNLHLIATSLWMTSLVANQSLHFQEQHKVFFPQKKLSVPLDELRLLHNSLILSALTFSWLLGLFHCSHILGHCLLSCKHNLQFPPHCTLFYLDSSYFITVVLPWSWCDWLSRYQQVSQWWLSSLPLGQS